MFNKVVAWAQLFDPSYRIVPITLSDGNDADDDNRERRNHFYENSACGSITEQREVLRGLEEEQIQFLQSAIWSRVVNGQTLNQATVSKRSRS